MLIRTARKTDIAAIARLSRQLAAHVADPDPGPDAGELTGLGFADDSWFDCLVAEVDAEVVGFALYCRRLEAHTRSRQLWLGDLVVAAHHRRRGAGRMLLSALRRKAVDMGCDGIVLELWTENRTARDFYDSVGGERDTGLEIWRIPSAERCVADREMVPWRR